MHVSLALLVLKTNQIETLKTFYEAIGLDFVEERHGSGPLHWAATIGETVFEIYPLGNGQADSTTRLGFAVPDLQQVVQTLGRQTLAPPATAKQTPWGLRAVVQDPDGRTLELYQRDSV